MDIQHHAETVPALLEGLHPWAVAEMPLGVVTPRTLQYPFGGIKLALGLLHQIRMTREDG